jgi:hypothetical protein
MISVEEAIDLVNEKRIRVMAVDIGNNGGIVVNTIGHHQPILFDMPKSLPEAWDIFQTYEPHYILAENVHTWKGQGIVSQGTLLQNRGRIEGMAAAIKVDIDFIEPLEWIRCFTIQRKKHFETNGGKKSGPKWKKHLLHIAQQIGEGRFLLDLGTCDAFLMWIYAAYRYGGEPLKPQSLQFSFNL